MAYNMKDVFYLDTSILTTTSAGDGIQNIDLSSYVDPIARGRAKGTGLAIYKVFLILAILLTTHQSHQAAQGSLDAV